MLDYPSRLGQLPLNNIDVPATLRIRAWYEREKKLVRLVLLRYCYVCDGQGEV